MKEGHVLSGFHELINKFNRLVKVTVGRRTGNQEIEVQLYSRWSCAVLYCQHLRLKSNVL